jgi:uncharacterized protein DUF4240
MNRKEFWELIDKTRSASGGDHHKQAELLVGELAKLSEAEILDYQEILDDLKDEAYIAELWEVAEILDMGCGDDGFMDFRAWLIGQGKEVFDKALVNPESLVDFVEPGQATKSEALLYVALEAYELSTGKDIQTMPRRIKPRPTLKGKHSKDEDSMLKRFPKAKEKFWDWWSNNMDKWFES